MTRTTRLLLVVVAAEVVAGGVLAWQRMSRPAPPGPDPALVDPATLGDLRTAAANCTTAADWRTLGEWHMTAGCFAESEMCHRVACRLDPGDATMARQWAFALERLALLDEANAQYRRAMELRPEEADAGRYMIARNLLRADRPAEAKELFAEGRALAANRYELARLQLRTGDLDAAEELHGGLLAERPNALQVHLLGYRLAVERGDARRAFESADRARYAPEKLLNPFDAEAARVVAAAQAIGPGRQWATVRDLLRADRVGEAAKFLQDAARTDHSPAVLELLAEVAAREGRYAAAIELLTEYQERNGPTPRLLARTGELWQHAGDPARGRAYWLAAADLGAGVDLKAVHHNLARSFAAAGDRTAADFHLARGHYFVGLDLLRMGRPGESVAYFEAAIRHDPAFAQARFYLGEALRLAGRDGAAAAYRACLERNPGHGRAAAALAYLEAAARK